MAVKCIHSERGYMQGQTTNNIRKKFIMDSEDDVKSLPKCCPGSIAIVAEGGKTYVVNASGAWVLGGTATYSLAEEASF